MKFGHFCLPTFFPDVDGDVGLLMRRWLGLMAESEALGFDFLWANEHHFDAYGGLVPSPPTMLAALSQRTTQVRLGTSIVVLPLHDPIEIAEQLAMVDLMSGGRVEFGIGRGFVEFDYDRLGVSRDDAQARMYEQLEIIVKSWSGEPFAHDGRYYTYKKLEVLAEARAAPASADLAVVLGDAGELRMGRAHGLQHPDRPLSRRRAAGGAETGSIAIPGRRPVIPPANGATGPISIAC